MEEEIKQYLNKSIVDISRKCGVYIEDVVKTIKKLYGNEN
jgi:hypothetical protein